MAALDVIRRTYEGRKRKLPPDAPLAVRPRRWRPHVVTKEGVSRAGYELCAFSCLSERLARRRRLGGGLDPLPRLRRLPAAQAHL